MVSLLPTVNQSILFSESGRFSKRNGYSCEQFKCHGILLQLKELNEKQFSIFVKSNLEGEHCHICGQEDNCYKLVKYPSGYKVHKRNTLLKSGLDDGSPSCLGHNQLG